MRLSNARGQEAEDGLYSVNVTFYVYYPAVPRDSKTLCSAPLLSSGQLQQEPLKPVLRNTLILPQSVPQKYYALVSVGPGFFP